MLNSSVSMPSNVEAEQGLIGALLFDNSVYERLSDLLSAEHFFEPLHGLIFAEIEARVRLGAMADPALLQDALKGNPAYQEFGGLPYLVDLMDKAPPSMVARDYGNQIIELARRRDLHRIGQDMATSSLTPEAKSIDLAEDAEGRIYSLMEAGSHERGIVSFSNAMAGALETMAAAYQNQGKLSGLSTGLEELDKKLGGLHPSDLLILAGRPSMGKTALATNIAFDVARNYKWEPLDDGTRKTTRGGVVLFFSLEMSAEQLAGRILADVSGVSSDKLRKGQIDASEFGRVRDAAIEFDQSPLYVDDTGGLSIAKMAARARRQKRLTGLDLIVVDYLQLLTVGGARSNANRVEMVSEITGALKSLAKELSVPVIALSQLSRQVEQREDKRPQLSDLRESGSIEQDADCVMFVYREEYYLEREEPREGSTEHLDWETRMDGARGRADVIIGKQRHGPIGTIQLAFNAEAVRFGNLDKEAWR